MDEGMVGVFASFFTGIGAVASSSSSQPSTRTSSRSSTPSTVVPTPRPRRSRRLNPHLADEVFDDDSGSRKSNSPSGSLRHRPSVPNVEEEVTEKNSDAIEEKRPTSPVLPLIEPLLEDPAWFFDEPPKPTSSFLVAELVGWRLFLLFLQFFFNHFDFSTDAFKDEETFFDWFLMGAFGGLKRWDAVHFMHIAEHGYVFEQSLAFYPLFPLIVRILTRLWAFPLVYIGLIHVSTAYYLTALAVNFMAFVISGGALYRIVRLTTKSQKRAIIAVLVFSINPASVFYSAPYTEALYSMFTFCGLALLVDPSLHSTLRTAGAGLCFAMSISNGLLNLLYLLFFSGVHFLFAVDENGQTRFTYQRSPTTVFRRTLLFAVEMGFIVPLTLFPLVFFGRWQVSEFCYEGAMASVPTSLVSYAKKQNWVLRGDLEELVWCNSSWWVVPPWYAIIQRKYWDVKLFGYWQLKKIPCFLMAAPAIFLVFYGCLQTTLTVWRRYRSAMDWLREGYAVFAFALHSLAITGGALFLYNVEVATRLLFSSSPFLYIVLANYMAETTPKVLLSDLFFPNRLPFLSYYCWKGKIAAAILLYLLAYTITGTMMFVTWLPFT